MPTLPLQLAVAEQQNFDWLASVQTYLRLASVDWAVCLIPLAVVRRNFDFSKHSTRTRSSPCSGIPLFCMDSDCNRSRSVSEHSLPDGFEIAVA